MFIQDSLILQPQSSGLGATVAKVNFSKEEMQLVPNTLPLLNSFPLLANPLLVEMIMILLLAGENERSIVWKNNFLRILVEDVAQRRSYHSFDHIF